MGTYRTPTGSIPRRGAARPVPGNTSAGGLVGMGALPRGLCMRLALGSGSKYKHGTYLSHSPGIIGVSLSDSHLAASDPYSNTQGDADPGSDIESYSALG